jgi:hypothetical protein
MSDVCPSESMAIEAIAKVIAQEFEKDGQPVPPEEQLRGLAQARFREIHSQSP